MAQRQILGNAASPRAKAEMSWLGRFGDFFAQKTLLATVEKGTQTITFDPPATADHVTDSPLTLTASSSAGRPVSLTLVSGPATLAGHTLTLTGAGDVVVQATQAGDDNYSAATPVQKTIVVS